MQMPDGNSCLTPGMRKQAMMVMPPISSVPYPQNASDSRERRLLVILIKESQKTRRDCRRLFRNGLRQKTTSSFSTARFVGPTWTQLITWRLRQKNPFWKFAQPVTTESRCLMGTRVWRLGWWCKGRRISCQHLPFLTQRKRQVVEENGSWSSYYRIQPEDPQIVADCSGMVLRERINWSFSTAHFVEPTLIQYMTRRLRQKETFPENSPTPQPPYADTYGNWCHTSGLKKHAVKVILFI